MPLLLSFLLPLLRRRDTWYLLLIALLALAFLHARRRADSAEMALAQRPAIETKIETRTVTHVVEGPERIVVRTVEKPGGERVVERIVERAGRDMTRGQDTALQRVEVPACEPAPRAPRWIIGYGLNPADSNRPGIVRGTLLFDLIAVSYGHELTGRFNDGHRVDLGIRF